MKSQRSYCVPPPGVPRRYRLWIKRLVTKGALAYEKESRVFVYTPLVKENEYIGQKAAPF